MTEILMALWAPIEGILGGILFMAVILGIPALMLLIIRGLGWLFGKEWVKNTLP